MAAKRIGCIDLFARTGDGRLVVSGWVGLGSQPLSLSLHHRKLSRPLAIALEANTEPSGRACGVLHPRPDAEAAVAGSKHRAAIVIGFAAILIAPDAPALDDGWSIAIAAANENSTFEAKAITIGGADGDSQLLRIADAGVRSLVRSPTLAAPTTAVVTTEPVAPMLAGRPADAADFAIDRAVIIGSIALVHGWLADPNAQARWFGLQSNGEAISDDMRPELLSRPRPDVQTALAQRMAVPRDCGFIGRIPLRRVVRAAMPAIDGCLRDGGGQPLIKRSTASNPQTRIDTVRAVTELWDIDGQRSMRDFRKIIGPCLADIGTDQRWGPRSDEIDAEVVGFGRQPVAPRCSILIPLYGRYDFILYQCSLFAGDPIFRLGGAEIIYIVDDPTIHAQATRQAVDAHGCFQVPFRLLLSPANLGYAGANNLGARHARGECLILLNSDAFPTSPGWIERLTATACQPGVGAVGTRLVFGDDAIQHDGITFERLARFWDLWFPQHPGKGLPAMTPVTEPVQVPAVTGACLAITRRVYQDIGGLDEAYLLGDFEDTDLCLRLRERGHRILIDRGIVLRHLERMSQNLFPTIDWKFKVTLANAIRFNDRWGDALAKESATKESAGDAA